MQQQTSRFAYANARRLRSTMTDAEQRLWYYLRRNHLGARFRRQHPFGPYIADFACLDPKIIIEVDGSQHFDQRERDQLRDRFFASHGFATLRFHSSDVLAHTQSVLGVIFEAVTRIRFAKGDKP